MSVTMSCAIRLAAVVAGAATLAACGQSPFRAQRSDLRGSATRQAAIEHPRRTPAVSVVRRVPAPDRSIASTQGAPHGIASFYTEGTKTASGERFDTNE